MCSIGRAVAPEELIPIRRIVVNEIEQSIEVERLVHVRAIGPGPQIRHHPGAVRCTVGAPELISVDVVIPAKIQVAVENVKVMRKDSISHTGWIGVVYHRRAGGGAIGLPYFGPVLVRIASEIQKAVVNDRLLDDVAADK